MVALGGGFVPLHRGVILVYKWGTNSEEEPEPEVRGEENNEEVFPPHPAVESGRAS